MSDSTDIKYECYLCADLEEEIERLTALRKEDRNDMQRLSDQLDYLSDENAKLQAVVDAADRIYADYEDDCNIQSSWRSLGQALAMWKEADDE